MMNHKMITLDETFAHDYECEYLAELPGAAHARHYFPGGETAGGGDGLTLRVIPRRGGAWLGTFAFGFKSSKAASGLYSWPDPARLCVVSSGQGYLVDVDEPGSYDLIRPVPIINVLPVAERSLVVFVNYTTLTAYGGDGLLWETKRLSWEGIDLTSVTGSFVEGVVWDPRIEAATPFTVDLRDGSHRGGIDEF